MTRYSISLALIALALSSCEYGTTARIRNDTPNPILVKVCLHKSNKPVSDQLKSYKINNGRDNEVVFTDSAHLKITYNVISGTSLWVFNQLVSPPRYDQYDSIYVFSADTLRLLSPAEISNAIRKTDKYLWELSIKR